MRKRNLLALGSVAVAGLLLLTACGGGASSETPEAGSESESLSAEAEAAQAIVDEAMKPVTEFVAPGPEIDASSLDGGTVHFIVPDTGVALFVEIESFLTEAFDAVGLSVQMCGTQATSPEGVANCLQQAIDQDATAVVTGAIPHVIAPTAFDAVIDAGIPLLYTLAEPAGPGDPSKVAYFAPDTIMLQAWNANWIIADSNAQATVLAGREPVNPVLASWTEIGVVQTFEENCSECSVEVIDTGMAGADQIASDVSTSLLNNPDIEYVQVPFDSMVSFTTQGIQSSGYGPTDISVVSTDASLAVVQQLAQEQYISAAAGYSIRAFSWYATDEVLRMLTGGASIEEDNFPYMRLFTQDNVGELDVTEASWADGSWYGETDFESEFLSLWGVA